MHKKDNVILIDFEPKLKWKFLEGIRQETNKDWKVIGFVSNRDRLGRIANIRRYLKYFIFTFIIYLKRKSYQDIIAWQQFYGLIFAFYCRFFHCKKVNKLVVMTFIYKAKTGIAGRLYQRFISYIVKSSYIDKIICSSSNECAYYAALFHMEKDKFSFVYLGEELEGPDPKLTFGQQPEKGYILSVGYSFRDYDFLIDVLKDMDYQVRIYGGRDCILSDNIRVYKNVARNNLSDLLANCRCIAIPLKDPNVSAGQLSILHAMQAGKPVIATDTKGICDYITQGENGFIAPNKKQVWLEYIRKIYNDEELYQTMCRNAANRYKTFHTLEAMGRNVGYLL